MDLAAYHEAAHVYLARRLGGRVLAARLDEDGEAGDPGCGRTEVLWPVAAFTAEELALASARVALAGPAAEIVLSGEVVHPAAMEAWAPDWEEALAQAGALEVEDPASWCEERLIGIVALLRRRAPGRRWPRSRTTSQRTVRWRKRRSSRSSMPGRCESRAPPRESGVRGAEHPPA